jgi:NADH/F420H2 dehydrogenase subunit C
MFINNRKDLALLFDLPNILTDIGKLIPIFAYQNFKDFEYSLITAPDYLIFVANVLKNHINYQYTLLSCISGVDLLKQNYRFMIAYEFLSLTFNSRMRIKVFVNDYDYIPSLTFLFVNANWWEREVWDLFGLFFFNHPDLRRILTDYGFEGYPLRKDFPLFGFRELRYDNNQKIIVSEPVVLSQEFRFFDYETPW